MPEQVQQTKTKAEKVREPEVKPEEHGRTDEQEELLEATDDLLAEIDDLLPPPVTEIEYVSKRLKSLADHLIDLDAAYELVFDINGVVVDIVFDSFCIC